MKENKKQTKKPYNSEREPLHPRKEQRGKEVSVSRGLHTLWVSMRTLVFLYLYL